MDIQVLGLKVDASGAITQIEKVGKSLDGLTDEANQAKRAVESVGAQRSGLTPLSEVFTKDTKALQGFSSATNDAAALARQFMNEQLAIVDANLAAEVALTGTTNALTLSSRAMTVTTAAASTLWRAIGGPAGAAVIAISGAVAIINELRQRTEEAAAAKRKLDDAFNSSTIAQASRELAAAEQQRFELIQKIQTAAPGRELAETARLLNEVTRNSLGWQARLQALRGELTGTGDALRGAFIARLNDAKGELAALASGGTANAEAFAQANREWLRSGNTMVTLAAAIANGDKAAIALLASSRELVDVNNRLSAAQRAASEGAAITARNLARERELVAENAAAWVKLTGELQANAQRRAELAKQLSTDTLSRQSVIAALTVERDVLREGADAYAEYVRQQAEAAAIRDALSTAEAAGVSLSEESISAIRGQVSETIRLQREIETLKGSLGSGDGLRIISRTTADDASTLTRELQSAVSAAGALSQAFGDSADGVARLVAGLANAAISARSVGASVAARDAANVGNAGYSSGATFSDTAPLLVSAAGVFGSIVSIIQGSVAASKAETERLRANAEAFNEGLALFAAGGRGGISDAQQRLQEAQKEAERLADLVDRATDPRIAEAFRALRANFEQIGGDILADIRRNFNIAIGNEDANSQQAAIDAYNERLANLADLLKVNAITQQQYNEAIAQSGVILQDSIRDIEQAAQKAEAARQRLNATAQEDFAIRALNVTDPRAGRDASFYADQQRAVFEAIEDGLDATSIAALRFTQALEAMAFEAAKAETDLRTVEGLLVRALNATGNTSGGDLAAFNSGQRQELADAILAGFTPTQLALLEFTQFAEREQFLLRRAIEEQTQIIQDAADLQIAALDRQIETARAIGAQQQADFAEQIAITKANADRDLRAIESQLSVVQNAAKVQTDGIDEQLRAIREQSNGQRQLVQLASKQLTVAEKAADALRAFGESLLTGEFSPLSPEARLRETRGRFETVAGAAQRGDADAAASLPNAARELLQASRGFNASGPGFVQDFSRVQSITDALAGRFTNEADIARQQLIASERAVSVTEQQLAQLQSTREQITRDAQRQIDALQQQRTAIQESSRLEIQTLQDFKDAAAQGNAELIAQLTEQRQGIIDGAAEQIRIITAQLTEQTQARIEANDFYRTFLELSGQSLSQGSDTSAAQLDVSKDQLSELKRVVSGLESGFGRMAEQVDRLTKVSVAGAEVQTTTLKRMESRLGSIDNNIRLTSTTPARTR